MTTKPTILASVLGLAFATAAFERDALACGGCFHPPPAPQETPSTITDHRMLLSISTDQSTLYDQIKFSGTPSSFAWVLPIAGTVDVGLSADVVFGAFDGVTQTTIVSPPKNCPAAPTNCASAQFNGGGSSGGGGAIDPTAPPGSSDTGGVTVVKQQVVGPYETVQLASTDPAALSKWLASHGYAVPPDVQPTIDQYVSQSFNFLAMKLVPGAGVQDMRPVRVTTKGASATLPLRMVSAGTGANVGITLWVLAEGRYEPQNFPSFHVDTNDIAWDWTQEKSNYTDLRQAKSTDGRSWEIESSITITQPQIQSVVYGGFSPSGPGGGPGGGPPPPAAADYAPVTNPDGTVAQTPDQVRDADIATMFHGIGATRTRVTRIRGDIAHDKLKDADLFLIAGADQTELSNVRNLTKELNQPECPVYDGCNQVGTAPRDEAIARSQQNGSSHESFSCQTGPGGGEPTWIALGGALLALLIAKAARSRRNENG
jgi:hypothetical protein